MKPPFVIARVIDAPRERVWRAWTEVEQLKQWWGPKGLAVTHCTVDPLNPDWPREMLSAATFGEQGGKTRLGIEWVPVEGSSELESKACDESRAPMTVGLGGTLDQLAASLAR